MSSFRDLLSGKEAELDAFLLRVYAEDDRLWHELDHESDRGMVLAAAAYFDNVLQRCISAYFDKCKASDDLLLDNRALGTFSSRAKCCRALRIVGDVELQRLNIIGRVRNKFAHELMTSFDEQPLSDLVRELTRLGTTFFGVNENSIENGRTASDAFRAASLLLALDLQRREIEVLRHTDQYGDRIPSLLRKRAEEAPIFERPAP